MSALRPVNRSKRGLEEPSSGLRSRRRIVGSLCCRSAHAALAEAHVRQRPPRAQRGSANRHGRDGPNGPRARAARLQAGDAVWGGSRARTTPCACRGPELAYSRLAKRPDAYGAWTTTDGALSAWAVGIRWYCRNVAEALRVAIDGRYLRVGRGGLQASYEGLRGLHRRSDGGLRRRCSSRWVARARSNSRRRRAASSNLGNSGLRAVRLLIILFRKSRSGMSLACFLRASIPTAVSLSGDRIARLTRAADACRARCASDPRASANPPDASSPGQWLTGASSASSC